MKFQTLGDKKDFVTSRIRNAEVSATIKAGQPVILVINGTEDGLRVVLPSTATAGKSLQFLYGICTYDIVPGQVGDAFRDGIYDSAMVVRQTRASSTDTWDTMASVATGVILSVNTVANAFSTVASTTTAASNTTISMSSQFQLLPLVAASYDTAASSASATSDTRTAVTVAVKVYCRFM